MTDQEIIRELTNIWKNYNYAMTPDEVFIRAINAIKQTWGELDSNSRMIDADELIRRLEECNHEPTYNHADEDWYNGICSAEAIVELMLDEQKNQGIKASTGTTTSRRTFTKYPQSYVKANDNQNDSEELGVWLESYEPTSPYLCNQCFTHSDRRYRRCPSCKTLMDLKHKY